MAHRRPPHRPSAGSPDDGEFARLLAEEGRRDFAPLCAGERVKGRVVGFTADAMLVDVGQRSEGIVPLDQVREEDLGRLRVGDRAEFVVSSISGAGIELSWALSVRQLDLSKIIDAQRAGLPIEGKVAGENKGGFTVDLPGAKGFVPYSQMELGPAQPLAEYAGRVLRFRVLEVRGKDVVLSRASLLKEERERERRELLAKLTPGLVLQAPVASVERYGIFVDLGAGISALVPQSEIAWAGADEIKASLSAGDVVTVTLLEITQEKGRPRVSASMRKLADDPWSSLSQRFAVGQVVRGTVTRLVSFGAFVALEPGVEGLLHVSEMSSTRRVQAPSEAVKQGQAVEAVITALDAGQRRISLSVASVPDATIDPEARAKYMPPSGGSERLGSLADAFRRAQDQKKGR